MTGTDDQAHDQADDQAADVGFPTGAMAMVEDEPRVHDLALGERIGLASPVEIRNLVERNRGKLLRYGIIAERPIGRTGRGGRAGRAFWLNEGQALVVCVLSSASPSVVTLRQVMGAFAAWRDGPPDARQRR